MTSKKELRINFHNPSILTTLDLTGIDTQKNKKKAMERL